MATVSWADFHYLVMPYLPGAPTVSVDGALRDAADEFLARTHVWREPLDPFDTEAGVSVYDLYATSRIEAVLRLTLDGVAMTPINERAYDVTRLAETGRPLVYHLQEDTQVNLLPTPESTYEIGGLVALRLQRNAAGIPDWIFDAWREDIMRGAIWRLAEIPNKSWSDQNLAMLERQRFDRAMANARTRDLRRIPQRVQMRRF